MKKTLLIFIIGLTGYLISYAQNDYKCLDIQKVNVPTFLLNSKILIGDLIYSYDSIIIDKIKSVNVIKSNEASIRLTNMGKYGIVDIIAPFPMDSKSLSDIKQWFNITNSKVIVAVDGFVLDNDSLLIATEAINEIKLIKNNNQLIGINIWTLQPQNRNGITTYKDDGKLHVR